MISGTTRDNMHGRAVLSLTYQAYEAMALKSMMLICKAMSNKHELTGIAMIHRLGHVAIGDESILIAASSPHRHAAFEAAREALEQCKLRVEIWKLEQLEGEEPEWRANNRPVTETG